jgi:hypothetical protein
MLVMTAWDHHDFAVDDLERLADEKRPLRLAACRNTGSGFIPAGLKN